MVKSLLVSLDSSENTGIVCRYAMELGKYFQSRVSGLHVLDVRKLYSPFVEDLLYSAGMGTAPDMQAHVRKRLENLSAIVENIFEEQKTQTNLENASFLIREGIVSEEICQEIKRHDLLVMGTKGEHLALRHLLLGSTFSEVISRISCPVLVVPAECKKFYIRKIMVAYDGSAHSAAVLRFVAASVKNHNLELELLVVNDANLANPSLVLQEARDYLSNHNLHFQSRIIKGNTVETIMEHLDATKSDLLAFGTSGSGLLKVLFSGSVSRRLLELTQVPVLVMG